MTDTSNLMGFTPGLRPGILRGRDGRTARLPTSSTTLHRSLTLIPDVAPQRLAQYLCPPAEAHDTASAPTLFRMVSFSSR